MKTVIIGDPGTGAYIFFRYLIWKETLENFIVVDDIKRMIEREYDNYEKR